MSVLVPSHDGFSLQRDNDDDDLSTQPLPAFLIGTRWVKANDGDPAYIIINGIKHQMVAPWYDPGPMVGIDAYEFTITINGKSLLFMSDSDQTFISIYEVDEDGDAIVYYDNGNHIIIGPEPFDEDPQ
jgi:hypothetical protein